MWKKNIYLIMLLSSAAFAEEYNRLMPQEYWSFMDGYEYQYPKCHVSWSIRTASFLAGGEGCDSITMEKMVSDAIKSINYVKKNSSYTNFSDYNLSIQKKRNIYSQNEARLDAEKIWIAGCLDLKKGLNSNDNNIGAAHNVTKYIKLYENLKRNSVINIYSDGWSYSKYMNGIINCSDYSSLRVSEYVSGIDIRN